MLTFYVNAAGSLAATAANLYAVRYGDASLRGLRAAIGALAGFYFGGYLWVIETGDAITWSAFYRRVAIVAWLLVWIFPPILGARAHQRTRRNLEGLARNEGG